MVLGCSVNLDVRQSSKECASTAENSVRDGSWGIECRRMARPSLPERCEVAGPDPTQDPAPSATQPLPPACLLRSRCHLNPGRTRLHTPVFPRALALRSVCLVAEPRHRPLVISRLTLGTSGWPWSLSLRQVPERASWTWPGGSGLSPPGRVPFPCFAPPGGVGAELRCSAGLSRKAGSGCLGTFPGHLMNGSM